VKKNKDDGKREMLEREKKIVKKERDIT